MKPPETRTFNVDVFAWQAPGAAKRPRNASIRRTQKGSRRMQYTVQYIVEIEARDELRWFPRGWERNEWGNDWRAVLMAQGDTLRIVKGIVSESIPLDGLGN